MDGWLFITVTHLNQAGPGLLYGTDYRPLSDQHPKNQQEVVPIVHMNTYLMKVCQSNFSGDIGYCL